MCTSKFVQVGTERRELSGAQEQPYQPQLPDNFLGMEM